MTGDFVSFSYKTGIRILVGSSYNTMNNETLKKRIKTDLKKVTDKKNVMFFSRGNSAIKDIIRLAKILGKEKVLIQDQGGWITYRQFANKAGLMCIDVMTDYGLTDLDDLERKADGKSIFIVNSLAGYYAEDDILKISKICEKKHCLLINDVSGSIGTKIAKYGNLSFGSFNKWKPIDLFCGGFIAFDDNVPSNYELNAETQQVVQNFFDTKEYFENVKEHEFKEKDLVKLEKKMNNLDKRNKFFSKMHWKIKKDLKDLKVIHPKKKGINVIIKYDNDEEKNKILKYCDENKLEYTECPRYIRVNEQAISIEVKRLQIRSK